MAAFMEEFASFSSNLNLTDDVMKGAHAFLDDTKSLVNRATCKIEKKSWFVCTIFVAVQDVYCPYDSSKSEGNASQPEVTVTQLLEKAEMNIRDFFNAMCALKTNHPLSNNSIQSFIALERKYLIVSALYDKFESMVQEIFCMDSELPKEMPNSAYAILRNHKSLCWILFLVAKAKVLWHRQELLATFNLLLCCIGEVIKATPTFLLLPPFDGIVAKSENSLSVLESLSNHVKTKFDEVKVVHNCWLHVAGELMSGTNLPELAELQDQYLKLYVQTGDIDESLFLKRDWHLLPSNVEQSNSPRKKIPALVRRTLDTADALNTMLSSTKDDLPDSLKKCLEICTIDAASLIKSFIRQSEERFVKEFIEASEGSDKTLAERRFKLASRYYYLMLDAMLRKEAERLSTSEFTSFLQNKIFHRSLLACCLEVTLMSCGSIGSVNFTPVQQEGNTHAQGIVFPWILKVFELKAFHFFKIIESFIRGAPTITQQIIKHLKQVEDKILDSLAWQSDSPVFASLSGQGCSQTDDTKSEKFESPNLTQSFWSPNKESPQKNLPNSPRSCHAVNIFLNKVSRLCYQRMEKLCALLGIKKEIQNEIWVCIEHILYKRSSFLKDRNLDQIIMCCIYAVSKILEQEVRFKTIISTYIQLPHASNSVYKQVVTNGKKEFIITFYNNHFFSEMNEYILSQFGSKTKPSASSLRVAQSPFVLSPAYSIPGKKNIFVSPLNQSPFKNPNEIIYQRSYIVGSQSPKKLQDINESLKVLQPASKNSDETKGKKRLMFDSEPDSIQDSNCAKKILRFYVPPNAKSFISKPNEPLESAEKS